MKGHVYFYYGSQTGCAESIAKSLHAKALFKGYESHLNPLNSFWPETETATERSSQKTKHVIIIVSTTGNGDPPENASKFWRKIRRRTQKSDLCSSIRFTILGLGDTNYDKFW